MLALRFLYIILALGSLACAAYGIRQKRRNVGFIILSLMIAVGDLFYYALTYVTYARMAGNVLLPYYILHSWFLFVLLIMIISIERFRRFSVFILLSAGVCAYQTYLVISQFFGARVFAFTKRIYFRKAWFVAADTKNTGLLFSYRSYRIMTYVNMLLLLIVLVLCIVYAHRIFKIRYIALFVMIVLYSILEGLTIHFTFPVCFPGIAYSAITLLCLYLTCIFARNRLREWSLDSFANDMSDGLILYDKHDDLIHINDMIRNTLDEDLVDAFSQRSRLDEWISESDGDDESNIITYTGTDREYYFNVDIRKLGGHGLQLGTLYILHDTTDSINRIKAMERANAELERASRMKSDFLANMSHEIRTPMNAVIGMAELAMRESDSPQITDYLMQIQGSGRNLLNIINDILDYSKIESGKMEIIEEEYEPFTELEDISNVLVTRIQDKDLELFVYVENPLPRKLYGDAMRIRQILINLANNAIKFTPKGLVKVHVSCDQVSDGIVNVTFHVIDTGIGIKKEDLDKLFVSFTQLDSRRNRSVEGTGLGLAISERLVAALGGQIGVESTFGEGSDFWFSVPQKVTDDTDAVAVENAGSKLAILYSGNEIMNEMFAEEMRNLGLDSRCLSTLDDYTPSGKKEFLFFEEPSYGNEVSVFLKEHSAVTGSILVDYDSSFVPDLPNLKLLRRPETTMRMVNILNGRSQEIRQPDRDSVFRIDFEAPDAKILIVDDNDINITIAQGLMAPLKVMTESADGGSRAVEMVCSNDYDIVLMDHMMPEIDGADATRMIRAKGDSIHQPVIIAVSANVMEEAKRLFSEVGMNDFVAKPINVRSLITTIRKWLPAKKIIEKDAAAAGDGNLFNTDGRVTFECEGVDTEKAVSALGSAELYDTIAEEYYLSGEDRYKEIMDAYDSHDWENYTIRVHSLKSSSRQIGAIALGDMAEALEKAGKAGDIDTIMSDNASVMEAYRRLLDNMRPYYAPGENDEKDKPMIDQDTLGKLLAELADACDELDMDAMEVVGNQLKEYDYSEEAKNLITSLHKAINEIDTEKCMEISDKLHRLI